jgi:hypothetical protein
VLRLADDSFITVLNLLAIDLCRRMNRDHHDPRQSEQLNIAIWIAARRDAAHSASGSKAV